MRAPSFSGDVREELSRQMSNARHCQIAEMAAILCLCGRVSISTLDRCQVAIQTENLCVARKYSKLLAKIFHINCELSVRIHGIRGQHRTYTLAVLDHEDSLRILQASRLLEPDWAEAKDTALVDPMIVSRSCCKRAFLRGAFLVAGSISDPNRFYHFEISASERERAEFIQNLLASFELDAKIIQRKQQFVVYIKEGAQIVDVLNVMEAHNALMELENIRIIREMRNELNRKVNCDIANLNKTVNAAVRQAEDIAYLRNHVGLDHLPENLRVIAELRLENDNASLKELGEMLDPPIGKSGVNHRLRKLSELAEKYRNP